MMLNPKILKLINKKEISNIAVENNTYSIQEKIIGKWIDGKPVYEAVINGIINSGSNYQTIYSNHVKHLIDYYGFINIQKDDYDVIIGKSIYHDGEGISRIIRLGENLRLDYQVIYHNCPFSAIVIYTKTTD